MLNRHDGESPARPPDGAAFSGWATAVRLGGAFAPPWRRTTLTMSRDLLGAAQRQAKPLF